MNYKSLLSLAAAGLLLASCNDEPKGRNNDDDSANIDYTESNAKSWGNYMAQVSALLRNDATTLYDCWATSYNGGSSYADIFKGHNGTDYSSAYSCVEQIIEGCAEIANEVGTAKIGDPYNLYVSGDTKSALYAVESWYSWHSRDDYSNNILSIRNSYYGSLDGTVSAESLSALIASNNATLDASMKEAIKNAYDAILGIQQPFRNHINSNESRKAMVACADLEELLSNSLSGAISAYTEAQLQRVVDNFVDAVVLPTYAELQGRNTDLHNAVLAFKAAPSDNAFSTACDAWLAAREPWEKSEAFLFGPVDALGLDPNMDSWPLDQDAIVQILTSGNFDNLNWSDEDGEDKIEAVQSVRGFHTLEFLLFKDGEPRKVNNN